jgi:cell division protein FtsZ
MAAPAVAAAEPLFERAAPAAEPKPEPVAEPEAVEETAAAAHGPATTSLSDDDWDLPAPAGESGAAAPLELDLEAEDEAATTHSAGEGGSSDELLLDASRLHEEDAPLGGSLPGRRRGLIASDSDEGVEAGGAAAEEPSAPAQPSGADAGAVGNAGADAGSGGAGRGGGRSGAGATLFERMANLSRGGRSSSEDEDEEEEGDVGGPSLSIPRFLGRQNNQ